MRLLTVTNKLDFWTFLIFLVFFVLCFEVLEGVLRFGVALASVLFLGVLDLASLDSAFSSICFCSLNLSSFATWLTLLLGVVEARRFGGMIVSRNRKKDQGYIEYIFF